MYEACKARKVDDAWNGQRILCIFSSYSSRMQAMGISVKNNLVSSNVIRFTRFPENKRALGPDDHFSSFANIFALQLLSYFYPSV